MCRFDLMSDTLVTEYNGGGMRIDHRERLVEVCHLTRWVFDSGHPDERLPHDQRMWVIASDAPLCRLSGPGDALCTNLIVIIA